MTMEKTFYFIEARDFDTFLDSLAESRRVFTPLAVENPEGGVNYPYRRKIRGDEYVSAGYRPSNPLKTFLFSRREKVADYPSKTETMPSAEPTVAVGAAACDVVSLRSLDVIFLQDEFTDIFYKVKRDKTIIISQDCTDPRPNCFCTLAGGVPYTESGFDLNISRSGDGFLVEIGSESGGGLVKEQSTLFRKADDTMLREREQQRNRTTKAVDEINTEYTLSRSRRELLEVQRESESWYEYVSTCVECGACLFACPTCHCFQLYDQPGEDGIFQRIKEWDACVYGSYSRMAGGGSPRLGLMERFRHRYLHKLEYYPKNFDIEACTGCGRCIEGCMGRIDMRKVFKSLDQLPVKQ